MGKNTAQYLLGSAGPPGYVALSNLIQIVINSYACPYSKYNPQTDHADT